MSGIAGIVRFDGKTIKTEELQTMLHSMPHDNYDDEGIWQVNNVALVHRMLWTTPESVNEKQPLVSDNARLVLTADARIDNRNVLLEQLAMDAIESDNLTDADLILCAYEKWGDNCPQFLSGDFAFTIWDKKEQRLFAARDRFAIKPFYFCFFRHCLYFSSYIDVLLKCVPLTHSVNIQSVKSFAAFATVNYENTMYETVFRIPPAHAFIFSLDGVLKKRYWFPENIERNYQLSFFEAKEKVKKLLHDAIKSRLRVYGGWGCELSGGLDSSAVALIANGLTQQRIKTFSMRYPTYACDEWEYTNAAIKSLNSRATCIDVDRLDFKDEYELNSLLKYSKNWPVYGSFIQNYALGKTVVANNVRVCLTGQGGDHVFTGAFDIWIDYLKNFQFSDLFKELTCSPRAYQELIKAVIRSITPDGLKKIVKKYSNKKSLIHFDNPENVTDYWKLSTHNKVSNADLNAIAGRQHVMYADNNHYRALEMDHKIEFRHPFFDTRLIEFVLSLPNQYKYRCGTIKIILREALKGVYPEKIYHREDKAEFSEALLDQMGDCDIKSLWEHSMLHRQKLVDRDMINELLLRYEQQDIDASDVGYLWRLTSLALWFKKVNNHYQQEITQHL